MGVHVLPHALDELSHLGFRLVGNQIRHANEQFATLNLELHHESQFVVALYVVDDLQEGTLILVETIENQWVALLHDGEPLPIGIGFRWEIAEERMTWVDKNAERTWGDRLLVVFTDGLEHTIVPIVRLKQTSHSSIFHILLARNQEHLAAIAQFLQHTGIEHITHVDAFARGRSVSKRRVVRVGINPKWVVVLVVRSIQEKLQLEFLCLLNRRDIQRYSSHSEQSCRIRFHCHSSILNMEYAIGQHPSESLTFQRVF